jgi:hypothetical protein
MRRPCAINSHLIEWADSTAFAHAIVGHHTRNAPGEPTTLASPVRPQVTAMWVYINYPNPHFTVHRDPSCRTIQMHGKPGQSVRRVSMYTLGDLVSEVAAGKIRFAAQSGFNDLWVETRLDTPDQEIGLVHVLQAILGRQHRPVATAPSNIHC